MRRHVPGAPLAAGLGLLMTLACGEPAPETDSPTAEIFAARTAGLTFLERDRLDEAQREFERLIELAPEEAIGYTNLGLVHLRGGDLTEAERAVRRALGIEPENPDIRLILARIYEVDGRVEEARGELEATARQDPEHVRTLYALAELLGRSGTAEGLRRRAEYLRRVVALEPANGAARLQLAETLLRGGEADAATAQLEQLRMQAPAFPAAAAARFREALTHMRAARTDEALAPLASFSAYFEVTSTYQAAMQELRGPPGTLVGIPSLTFSHEFSLRVQEEEAVLAAMRFTDATAMAGLDLNGTVIAVADYDGDGDQDLYAANDRAVASERSGFLLRNDLGRFIETTAEAGVVHAGEVSSAIFADYDNDRRLDLYIVRVGANLLYRNIGDGRFEDVTQTAGVAGTGGGAKAIFVDLDLDGDLDIYEARDGANRFYRNNGDGSFQERAAAAGIAGEEGADSRDVVFGDFDGDRDVDFFVINANGSNALFSNARQGRFEDVTAESGLGSAGSSGAAAVGDYDNDGFLDLFVTALSGGGHTLYRNEGDGTFEVDRRSDQVLSAMQDLAGLGAVFFDFDNDGHLDLLVVGEPRGRSGRGVFLFRNDGTGRFEGASRFLPRDLVAFWSISRRSTPPG
ncbi:MAG: FG-GAP-like repeat-containing protein [Planctomycetota bacterium]|nr:FG-GAP-like repeat-containing protein [Planctomycetota bacterium]